jgi:tetratricopeptide (TPR) repeat protein
VERAEIPRSSRAGTGVPAARAAAERALSLPDDLAEPHCSIAYTDHFFYRDWEASERGYRRAIELNHSYRTAHQWYALLLGSSRRFEEARVEIRRAQELDPVSIIVQVAHGLIATLTRDSGEASAACRAALALDQGFGVGHVWLGWAELLRGRTAEALAAFEEGYGSLAVGAKRWLRLRTVMYARAGGRRRPRCSRSCSSCRTPSISHPTASP